jgi:hypothetical protein
VRCGVARAGTVHAKARRRWLAVQMEIAWRSMITTTN